MSVRREVELPVGVVTFVFSDIEGSTGLLQELGPGYGEVLGEHHRVLRGAWAKYGGVEVGTLGDGFFVAFADPAAAVSAVMAAQRALGVHAWPHPRGLLVRMGVHTGTPKIRDGTYWGIDVHYAARLCAAANGGQVLLSSSAASRVEAEVEDLGEHALKDFPAPRRVFHLLVDGRGSDQFAPVRTLRAGQTNLPAVLSSFVGRERELDAVCSSLSSSRLVTLVGAGGVGKTRLALAAAARLLDGSGDGVWWAELAALRDPEAVARELARVLGVAERPGVALLDLLVDGIAQRRLLVVLDNCEHLIEAVALLVAAVVRRCPRVVILATSREPLRVAGERVYRVPSLSLPAAGVRQLEEYEAVRLFVERAREHRPGFAVDDSNAATVASIVRRLDGIPLAIELASARLRSLGVVELGARLEQGFRLLTGGSRTALARQQTLAALIDWSYELLSDRERVVLARLSVFAGGSDLAAAEAVCAAETIDDLDVIDLLTALVDKSLIGVDDVGESLRYRLLETVREYAADRLAEHGESALRSAHRAHRDFYLELAEASAPLLGGPDQVIWQERLKLEHDNLRAALRYSLTEPDPEPGLRLVGALRTFWRNTGDRLEGAAETHAQLRRTQGSAPTPARGWALVGAATFAEEDGDFRLAEAYGQEAVATARACDDDGVAAEALSRLGWVRMRQGRTPEASQLTQEAVTIARTTGDATLLVTTLRNRIVVQMEAGADVRDTALELAQMCRAAGNRAGLALALQASGLAALHTGDISTARAELQEVTRLADELGDASLKAYQLQNMGLVEYLDDARDAARALYVHALALTRSQDKSQRADRRTIPYTLLGLALTTSPSEPEQATKLHGVVDRLLDETGETLERLERRLRDEDHQRLTALLSPERFHVAHAAGWVRPLDEIINTILGT